jgi:hypothetical protein
MHLLIAGRNVVDSRRAAFQTVHSATIYTGGASMFFRVLLATIAALFSSLAIASGPYDGIYHMPGTKNYLTVLQNANYLFVEHFTTIDASGIVFYLGDGQAFPIRRADLWDLYTGNISGNTSVLVGQMAYGACESTKQAVFSGTGVTVTQLSIRNTADGTAAGISCAAYQSYFVYWYGTTSYWERIF